MATLRHFGIAAFVFMVSQVQQSPHASAAHTIPQTGSETELVSFEDQYLIENSGRKTLQSRRVRMAEPYRSSWSNDATSVLGDGDSVSSRLNNFRCEREGNSVVLYDQHKVTIATRKLEEFKATKFDMSDDTPAAKQPRDLITAALVDRGIDVEIPDEDGNGIAVYRVERTWRGLTVGIISGWEFDLGEEKLYVVDNGDGVLSDKDWMTVGTCKLRMPWQTLIVSGTTVYYDVRPEDDSGISFLTRTTPDLGKNQAVWNEWQSFRKKQGLPAQEYDEHLHEVLLSHAQYCSLNKVKTLKQESGKKGYKEEWGEVSERAAAWFVDATKDSEVFGSLVASVYQRQVLINPFASSASVAANTYATLYGTGPTPEELPLYQQYRPQLCPAPDTTIVGGTFGYEVLSEIPTTGAKPRGTPITIRFFGDLYGDSSWTFGLKSLQKSRDGTEKSKDVPAEVVSKHELAGFHGLIALIPEKPLQPGEYEATYSAPDENVTIAWRFHVVQR